ncbi:hypothetical protein [Kitasatospora sp. NPDC059571]|uniref:hypothetical protein n=1 Tax=Kitasatospora sp. NPDC059571 TaxID=3346871 RepID=UPI0036AEC21B
MRQRIRKCVKEDTGIASVEYLGTAVLVAVVVGSILMSNPGADTSGGLAQQACRLIQAGSQELGVPGPGNCGTASNARDTIPGNPAPSPTPPASGWHPPGYQPPHGWNPPAPPEGWNPPGLEASRMQIVLSCTDRAVQEAGGGGVTLFGLHVGGSSTKAMELRGDGSAWVTKQGQGEIGIDMVLGATSADGSVGLGGGIKANLTGSYTRNYHYNDWRKAESFYHDGDNAHDADSRTFDVGVQAGGFVGFGPASADASITGGGNYTVFDNPEVYGNFGSRYTGYLSGKASLGLNFAIAGGKGKVAGVASYSVVYDRNGEPDHLIFNAEGTAQGSGQAQLPGVGPVGGALGGGGGGGTKWTHQWYLDLHDPLNRSAFDRAFSRRGWFAVPNLVDLDNGFGPMADLADRIRQDSIEVESQYAMSGDGAELGAKPNDPKKWGGTVGAAILSFGIEGQGSQGTSQLQGDDTVTLDHHVPGATWRPLSDYNLCGKSYFAYCEQEYGYDKCPSATGRLRSGDDARSNEVL